MFLVANGLTLVQDIVVWNGNTTNGKRNPIAALIVDALRATGVLRRTASRNSQVCELNKAMDRNSKKKKKKKKKKRKRVDVKPVCNDWTACVRPAVPFN